MLQEAIYKGATRPPMKFGIPLVPLVSLFASGMLIVMWGGAFVSWWIAPGVLLAAVPTLAWMRLTTARDDQRFRQLFLALKLRTADRNGRLWKSRSYSPYLYHGGRDAWRQ